jgi:hypothetical protein
MKERKLLTGKDAITVLKDKAPVKSMTDIQLDLLLSYIGTSTIIKCLKSSVQIKWDKMVSKMTGCLKT